MYLVIVLSLELSSLEDSRIDTYYTLTISHFTADTLTDNDKLIPLKGGIDNRPFTRDCSNHAWTILSYPDYLWNASRVVSEDPTKVWKD